MPLLSSRLRTLMIAVAVMAVALGGFVEASRAGIVGEIPQILFYMHALMTWGLEPHGVGYADMAKFVPILKTFQHESAYSIYGPLFVVCAACVSALPVLLVVRLDPSFRLPIKIPAKRKGSVTSKDVGPSKDPEFN